MRIRRAVGAAAALAAVVLMGREVAGTDAASRRALRDFDTVWRAYDRLYPYFDVKGVDWRAQRARVRPRAARARTEAERTAAILELLAPLRDVHATLVDPAGGVHRPHAPPRPSNWTAEGWLAEMETLDWHPRSPAWGWARIGDVGYLAISNWDPRQLSLGAVDEALATLADVRALVVDVRMNGGGEDGLALELAGRFTDRARVAQFVRARAGGPTDFGRPLARRVEPGGRRAFLRPVVVLTGAGSLSSTETFVAAMGELDHVTLAGDPTGGSSGHPVERRLGGGWRVTVPRLRARTVDGTLVEGHGIAPDVALPADSTPGAGDPVLRAALRLLGTGPDGTSLSPGTGPGPAESG